MGVNLISKLLGTSGVTAPASLQRTTGFKSAGYTVNVPHYTSPRVTDDANVEKLLKVAVPGSRFDSNAYLGI